MKRLLLTVVLGMSTALGTPDRARAYDIDCAIMLCMAGGFPPSAVCARAYRVMIRRITPWPSLPPFGICTYAAVPVSLGGPGGVHDLDTSLPDYAWLTRTHVIWFYGRSYTPHDDSRQWDWSIKSCDRENRTCRYLQRVSASTRPWPRSFRSEGGQTVLLPVGRGATNTYARSIMVEFGDYDGNMDHSDWFSY